MILKELSPLPVVEHAVTPDLAGHVLTEDVLAPHDIPATPTTSVDGYALRCMFTWHGVHDPKVDNRIVATDAAGTYTVLTPSTHALDSPLPEGSIYRINTGAPLPVGADAIIMVEDTTLAATAADGEEATVRTRAQVPTGENVRAPGSDVRAGALVLGAGDIVRSGGGELGTLAFVGRTAVRVHKRPVVALLSTGNELVDVAAPRTQEKSGTWGGIFDTNRPALGALLKGLGYDVLDLGIVRDEWATA
jgi:gephyrin